MLSHERIAQLANDTLPSALCIVTETSGSTPRKAGARMVVIADGTAQGRIEGTIGGGAVEHEVRTRALEVIKTRKAEQYRVALTHDLAMCCGGQMTFFIEPLKAKAPCIVLGAGHIGTALAAMASQSGFDLHLCDPRSELLHAERLPHAASLHQGYDETALQALPFGPDAFVVIATHSHQNDQDLVETLLMRPFRYLALVGSERKAAMTKQRCLNKGLSEADLARLHCPAGLAIAAQTPEEIAVSILAQMIQVKNSGH